MSEVKTTNSTDSKRRFDTEYSTQYIREYKYLRDHNISCSFIKRDKNTGVITYKYKKTPQLFAHLSVFYESLKNEKEYEALQKLFHNDSIPVYTANNKEDAMRIISDLYLAAQKSIQKNVLPEPEAVDLDEATLDETTLGLEPLESLDFLKDLLGENQNE